MDKMKRTYKEDLRDVHIPCLEALTNSNILVTGATGLIGGCLVNLLSCYADKYRFHIYAGCRSYSKFTKRFGTEDNYLHFKELDVDFPISGDTSYHYIIHAASLANPSAYATQPVEVMKSNIYGTVNLIEYGRAHGMRSILYVSSGEVYGEGNGQAFKETDSGYVDCATPRACYPSAKRAAETLCVSYAAEYGIDTRIARPCHVYGPYFTESDNRVYAQFIRNVLRGEDIVMKSTGTQYRSWCYVVDCASALLHILLKGENGQAYNVADETSNISIRQLAEMIASIGGKKVVMQVPDEQEKRGYNVVRQSTFDTTKLKALGWQVKGTMTEKLENTINALLHMHN